MNSALIIILGFLLLAVFLGIRSTKGKQMDLEQWTVGGRGFSAIFVFLLMAGEIYTTFSFLGGSGWAYGKGAPALYVLMYICLSYVVSYWLLPVIWRYAKEHKLVSQSDFFVKKYNSPYLGVLVALVGVIGMIPVIVVQLKGLGIIVSQASYGAISMETAVWIGAISLTIYVMLSGVHGSAWTALIKDIVMVVVICFLGIYLPLHYFGGFQPMFEAVHTANPDFLRFPDDGNSVTWVISTVLLLVLGFYMWPQVFSSTYTAKNARVFRKNAIISPLYTLMLLFVFFVGTAAILTVPGLEGEDVDLALIRISMETFDPWVIGVIGGAGLLTALVPGSLLIMSTATLLAKNIYNVFAPKSSQQTIGKLARLLVPVVSLVAVLFTLHGGATLSNIILMGYSLMTQLAPSLFFSLGKKNFVNKYGAGAGILAGLATVAYITLTHTTLVDLFPFLSGAWNDVNTGIIALVVNLVVMTVVSLLTAKRNQEKE
ncbi:sodium:solute symporter [Terribacillus sp. DMT04]|uniref:sodium:solute symporter family protein n=1 Tax=Terribacillus sp. DMT04 TaxID=2850441 RepID=UPI001C2BD281|nr:sodium:solute symporter [Terribacillus sp. DMT04]QXE01031.1 sodium:solute symporter [Terribacillus sp. DMT04]